MQDLSSHFRSFAILALFCTLYLGVMTVEHDTSDYGYHHHHQCEMFSGLQLGLVSEPNLPGVIPVKVPAFSPQTTTTNSTYPANLRARSPPYILSLSS